MTAVTTQSQESRARRIRRAVFTGGNILAGISVGAYFIPQAMAYASLAGLDPAAGLTVAVIPLIIYMILGRSVHMSVGPESTVALMAGAAVGPVAAATGIPIETALAVTCVLVGVILFGAWLMHASFLADLLSKPILVGYMTGVAVLMILSQLPKVLGYEVDTSTVWGLLNADWQVPDYHTLVIAIVVAAVALIARAINSKIPGPLIGLVAALLMGLAWEVPEVGAVSLGLPRPQLSGLSLTAVTALLVPAISIAIVSYTDVMMTSRAFAKGVPPDPDREMRAISIVQVATGIAGGYPVSASGSRTALAVAAGAKTRFYAIFVAVVLLAGPLLVPGVISAIPLAGLAGVIIYAAIIMIEPLAWRELRRFRKREVALAAICGISVVVLGILPGVVIAIALSVTEFIARLARPHEGILGFVPDRQGMHDIDDSETSTTLSGLVVFRYDAPLFFINASDFYKKCVDACTPGETKVLALNMEANVELDSTALGTLEQLHNTLDEQGIDLWLARVKNDVLGPMSAHGVAEVVGRQNMYETLPMVIAEYRRRFPDSAEEPRTPSQD